MIRTRHTAPLSEQIKTKVNGETKAKAQEYDGNFGTVISTGSTLLDLAISGGRIRGGGIPGGILVEVFGPSGSGKTVLLSEIAGGVQRQGGQIMFHDPEARLNTQFARLFGLELSETDYYQPDKVPEVFTAVRNWEVTNGEVINGVFADSLAALSTEQEMESKDGDKMGMRRAKEFSEELRKTCRIIKQNNYLMVCSNQVRQNLDAGPYGQKYTTPGGEAIGFYSSLRLRFAKPEKITTKLKVAGKEVKHVVGVEVQVEVFKSSIWEPYHTAPLIILFDYGIDDIQTNLQFIKDYTGAKVYTCQDEPLSNSMSESIRIIESEDGGIQILRQNVIRLWEELQEKLKTERKPKR